MKVTFKLTTIHGEVAREIVKQLNTLPGCVASLNFYGHNKPNPYGVIMDVPMAITPEQGFEWGAYVAKLDSDYQRASDRARFRTEWENEMRSTPEDVELTPIGVIMIHKVPQEN